MKDFLLLNINITCVNQKSSTFLLVSNRKDLHLSVSKRNLELNKSSIVGNLE